MVPLELLVLKEGLLTEPLVGEAGHFFLGASSCRKLGKKYTQGKMKRPHITCTERNQSSGYFRHIAMSSLKKGTCKCQWTIRSIAQ